MLSEALGAVGEDIMFSSNATPAEYLTLWQINCKLLIGNDFNH